MGKREPGDGTWDPRCARAGEAVLRRLTRRVEVHVARRCARCGLSKIERDCRSIGETNDHEAAASDIAGWRVRRRERETYGDCRIDRIAPAAQRRDADFGCESLLGGDGAVGAERDPREVFDAGRSRAHDARGQRFCMKCSRLRSARESREDERETETEGDVGTHRSRR